MARTITQIQNQIVEKYVAECAKPEINITVDPSQWSFYDIQRVICYVVAVCIWSLEILFDEHKAEVRAIIDNDKPHKARWYAGKAVAFQYGYDLVPNEDYYDNTGLTDEQIAESKVVKYAAPVEIDRGLRIKVATEVDDDLAPLPTDEFEAFKEYMKRVKDDGVNLAFTNATPDRLKLSYDIYYNPLVLKADGKRKDGTNDTPVQEAINTYLKSTMNFNGLFVPMSLTDAIQKVSGVVLPDLKYAQVSYGLVPYADVVAKYRPDGGYLRIVNPADLVLNFIPSENI